MERWGALSVTDHKDARALAAEVLLYDRLVVPEPYIGEVADWRNRDWDPDGLSRRLEQLGDDLAYRAVWSAEFKGVNRRPNVDRDRRPNVDHTAG